MTANGRVGTKILFVRIHCVSRGGGWGGRIHVDMCINLTKFNICAFPRYFDTYQKKVNFDLYMICFNGCYNLEWINQNWFRSGFVFDWVTRFFVWNAPVPLSRIYSRMRTNVKTLKFVPILCRRVKCIKSSFFSQLGMVKSTKIIRPLLSST